MTADAQHYGCIRI